MTAPLAPPSLTPSRDHVKIGGHRVAPELLQTLRQASRSTGVDFGFLVSQAAQESGFRTDAQATTSSARGLFQFIESTWLEMVRDHGSKYGIGELAGQIGRGSDGKPRVADPDARREILALRDDPRIASAMAAEYARANQAILSREFGVEASRTDLYLGHFLGSSGAGKFLTALRANPDAKAADLLPDAAAANRSVFYNAAGEKRSLSEIHANFSRKLEANAVGLDAFAEPALGSKVSQPGSVAQQLDEQRRQVDHMAKMMAFDALRELMQRANRLGRSSDSSW